MSRCRHLQLQRHLQLKLGLAAASLLAASCTLTQDLDALKGNAGAGGSGGASGSAGAAGSSGGVGGAAGSGGSPDGPTLPLDKVTAGGQHACIIDSVGAVFCWGSNLFGQLGSGTVGGNESFFVQASLPEPAKAVSAGGFHTCAIGSSGTLYCWGNGSAGQLGSAATRAETPASVAGLTAVSSVSAGGNHTCAVSSGTLHCWGSNSDGQLCVAGGNSSSPQAVSLPNVSLVAAGPKHTCAIATGSVRCCGANDAGQLGDPGAAAGPDPNPVDLGGQGVIATAVAAGGHHSCAMLGSGAVRCWGSNSDGQIGNGTSGQSALAPAVVSGLSAARLSLGDEHSCAVTTSATSACWGADDKGQVGDGSASGANQPFLHSLSGVTEIASGTRFSCALVANGGALQCWGDNSAAQLGAVAVPLSTSPIALPLSK